MASSVLSRAGTAFINESRPSSRPPSHRQRESSSGPARVGEPERLETAALQRVGLSAPGSNSEYHEQAMEEARSAEADLAALQHRASLAVAAAAQGVQHTENSARPGSRRSSRPSSSHRQHEGLDRFEAPLWRETAALDIEQRETAIAQRVGLSEASGNNAFGDRALHEARDAETHLDQLRRKAAQAAAKCHGQLDVVHKEVRAEMEQRELSERVARELDVFRAEARRKEALEEERLGHLYRAMLEPAPVLGAMPNFDLAYALPRHAGAGGFATAANAGGAFFLGDGTSAAPPIISSVVDLELAPLSSRRAESPAAAFRRLSPRPSEIFPRPPVPKLPRSSAAVHKSSERHSGAPDTARDLLRVNEERLRRLEKLGF